MTGSRLAPVSLMVSDSFGLLPSPASRILGAPCRVADRFIELATVPAVAVCECAK